jgi:putative chitinase
MPEVKTNITANDILALNKWLKPDRAAEVAKGLEAARPIASINTPRRVRHFIAQLAHESAGFTRLIESFYYKDPARLDDLFSAINGVADAKLLISRGPDAIANRVYANRLGNGNEASGDGAKYKGRGWIQITGKDNYAKAERYCGLPLVKEPGLAGRTNEAALIAAHYWRWNNINDEADHGDLEGVTRKINGTALAGLEDRKLWLLRAFKIWAG